MLRITCLSRKRLPRSLTPLLALGFLFQVGASQQRVGLPTAEQPTPPPEWSARLASSRAVVDRVVIAFDEDSFLEELARWDETHHWPVLLWDSELTPVFLRAFRPAEVLFARHGDEASPSFERGVDAVQASWGLPGETESAADIAQALRESGHPPQGAVLLASDSPEFLGGLALAAGRFHLPLQLEPGEGELHSKRVTHERAIELRDELRASLKLAQVTYGDRFDELDFITVANDWPFGYSAATDGAHPGSYTLDDLLARKDNRKRWGWVGRLMGGPQRSVYMAMGALFLQPESARFWSRYKPGNNIFGAFDPESSLDAFGELFPSDAIRHPDATLERWRAETWQTGNRHGFLYVNSSGGARTWSTSGAEASYLDIPGVFAGNVASVVHYSHSGSAGRPWDVDSIAGRWMAGGAYVYFGSHAEPYLQAFVRPSKLAERLAAGLPLGAAMRLDFGPGHQGQNEMEIDGEKQAVTFNMSGPWKLAYFGDPSYRLTGEVVTRVAPGALGPLSGGHFKQASAFAKHRPRNKDSALAHGTHRVALSLITDKPEANDRAWKKDLTKVEGAQARGTFTQEALRVWIGELSTATDRQKVSAKKWLAVPKQLGGLLAEGLPAPGAGRSMTDFVRAEVSRLDKQRATGETGKKELEATRLLLELLAITPHSKDSSAALFKWIKDTAKRWEISNEDLREAILSRDETSASARALAEKEFAGD